jgi:hypothetical protein
MRGAALYDFRIAGREPNSGVAEVGKMVVKCFRGSGLKFFLKSVTDLQNSPRGALTK